MGTIVQKTDRIIETKNNLKEVINYNGEKINNNTIFHDYSEKLKDVYIDMINDGIDNMYNNFPKVTEEGNNIILSSENAPMKISLKSNLIQTWYYGKNLFNPITINDETDIYTSGCTATLDEDILKLTATNTSFNFGTGRAAGGNYTNDRGFLMEVNASTKYTFTIDNTIIDRVYFNAYDSSKVSLGGTSVYGTTGTYTTPANAKYITMAIMCVNATIGTTYNFKVQVEKGENSTSYEPYVGAIVLPNPDSPETIKTVTGENIINVDGKNLFDDDLSNMKYSTTNNTLTQLTNGIRATFTGSSSENYKYSSLAIKNSTNLLGKRCTLRCNISQSNPNVAAVRIYQMKSDGKAASNSAIITANTVGNNAVTFTFPKTLLNTATGFGMFFYSNSTGTVSQNDYVDYTNIKLVSTPYEPYTSQSYAITLSGDNLFDKTSNIESDKTYTTEGEINTLNGASIQTDYIEVENGKMYTMSTTNDHSTATDFRLQILEYDTEKHFIKRNQGTHGLGNTTSYSVILGETTAYVRLGFTTETIDELRFEKGAVPIEYCKIGTYKDQFFKNTSDDPLYNNTLIEGDWYLKKNINKIILNGTETWNASTIAANSKTNRFSTANTNKHIIDYGFSDKFKVKDANMSVYDDIEMVQLSTSNSNKYLAIHINKSRLESNNVAGFISWLTSNHVTLYYVLYTPIYIHISSTDYPTLLTQLENLNNNIKSYNNETNLIINSNNNNAYLEVAATALKNINLIESEWE